MIWTSIGAIVCLLAVAAGAFGVHGLRGRLELSQLQIFETAARYQMFHGLALLFLGRHVAAAPRPAAAAAAAGVMAAGVLVFCGSLYALALGGAGAWGAVTPVGGLALLTGWGIAAHAYWPRA